MDTLKLTDPDGDELELEPFATPRLPGVIAAVDIDGQVTYLTRKDAKRLRRYLKRLLQEGKPATPKDDGPRTPRARLRLALDRARADGLMRHEAASLLLDAYRA